MMSKIAAHRGHGPVHDHGLAGSEETSHRLSMMATWAVSLCAVHCVVTPFAGLLPLIGLGPVAYPWFEWMMVALATILGGLGIGISYSQVHRDGRPGVFFATGLGLLVVTHLFLEGNGALHATGAVLGAIVIVAAGGMNHGLVHACQQCHPHPHGLARPSLLPPFSLDEIEVDGQ